MVQAVCGVSELQWWSELDRNASSERLALLQELVRRRRRREPLAYVLGEWSFRRLDLCVGPGVLIPRPETEMVVEVALGELRMLQDQAMLAQAERSSLAPDRRSQRMVDLGSGSGAIALSMVDECRELTCFAVERSHGAAEVMKQNLLRHPDLAVRVELRIGSWFRALPTSLLASLDLVVTNPPYVSESEWRALAPEVAAWEPRQALVPGATGLEAMEEILHEAPRWLRRPGTLVSEIASEREVQSLMIAESAGAHEVHVVPDLVGRPRILVARWLAS